MITSNKKSFSQVLRIMFVIFSLYLLGDVFSRWDGAKYYATLNEFLPSVALVFILWSLLAACLSFLVWFGTKLLSQIISSIKVEDIFILFFSTVIFAILLYYGKSVFRDFEITHFIKGLLLLIILAGSSFLTWLLHGISEKLFDLMNDHISPLVWLFGVMLILSVPLVAYKTLKNTGMEGSSYMQQVPVGESVDRENILLVTFDAMTARNMSVYGYERPTTPFIEEWSKSAALFSRVKSESTYTTPTTSSLMTGKRVWTHQTYFVEVASKYVGGNNENLPYLLKMNGYTNVALQQVHQASVRKLGLEQNFDVIFGPEQLSQSNVLLHYIDKVLYKTFGEKIIIYDWIIKKDFILFKLLNKLSSDSAFTSHPPERAFDKFLEILDNGLNEPYFAWIHVFAPHDPYLPPEPYKGMFNASDELRTWKSQNRANPINRIDVFRDRYDEFIRYADKQFETFISEIKKRNRERSTFIILSADHGESFAHNYKGHGGTHLYEDLTHIPLIIKEPGVNEGRVINELAEQIDITPTILEIARISVPEWMEGRSLLPLLEGKTLPPKRAFSMALGNNPSMGHEIKRGTIAIWQDDYKLIHSLDRNKTLLFNIRKDPYEINNLFDASPDLGNSLLTILTNELDAANNRIKQFH
jgi:arylsulfatase A-like enzyme